jgi:sarcosine oxidase subunit gamma
MPESPLIAAKRASPLGSHSKLTTRSIIEELPFISKISLRGRSDDDRFISAIRSATGLELPCVRGRIGRTKDIKALWLGPDEWLIVSAAVPSETLKQRMTDRLDGVFASVVDVSAGRTIVALSGERSTQTLLKGCSLDLHPGAFLTGHCAQTYLARAVFILEKLDDAARPAWHIYVANSFAAYLVDWLIKASRE